MDNLEFRGNLVYYRDRHIYTIPNGHVLTYMWWDYLEGKIEGLPRISISLRVDIKLEIERHILANKELIDKIIDGAEIYG